MWNWKWMAINTVLIAAAALITKSVPTAIVSVSLAILSYLCWKDTRGEC